MTGSHVVTPPDRGTLARTVATAVEAVPGVAGVDAGPYGIISTFGREGRVVGVALGGPVVTVGVRVRFGTRITELAEAVRAAATAVTGTPVDVSVVDVVGPGPDEETS